MSESRKGPYAILAEAAGKTRMRALVEETKLAQAKADHIELSGFLERIEWIKSRALVMQERHPGVRGMIVPLIALEVEIQWALREIEGKR